MVSSVASNLKRNLRSSLDASALSHSHPRQLDFGVGDDSTAVNCGDPSFVVIIPIACESEIDLDTGDTTKGWHEVLYSILAYTARFEKSSLSEFRKKQHLWRSVTLNVLGPQTHTTRANHPIRSGCDASIAVMAPFVA